MITLPAPLKPATDVLLEHGTFPVLVGGYVRDALLGVDSKDIDIEVYNVKNFETLKGLLAPFGTPNIVGKSFGVLKMDIGGYDVDFSLPRTELKKGEGHKGFDVSLNGQLDFATAARRRDFTVNAMGFDLNSSYLLDPYKGQEDLAQRRLRCVNRETFVEDPLRVLRAVQIAARFHLECDDALMLLCRKMVKDGALGKLPKERIFEEFKKLLLKSEHPSEGFRLMARINVLDLFPELSGLRQVRQNLLLQREGDSWETTLACVDAMASLRRGDDRHDLVLMLAALCHGLGTAETDHAEDVSGVFVEAAARRFLERLTDEKELVESVVRLVRHHLQPMTLYRQGAGDAAIRRLAVKVPLGELVLLAKAHYLALAPPHSRKGEFLAGEWLLSRARQAGATPEALKPLLQGRDLIEQGLTPSPAFKTLLDRAYDAQLEGLFNTHAGALEWLNNHCCDLG